MEEKSELKDKNEKSRQDNTAVEPRKLTLCCSLVLEDGSGHVKGNEQGYVENGGISGRGSRALVPFSPYIQAVNDAKKNRWSITNPDGYFLVRIIHKTFPYFSHLM